MIKQGPNHFDSRFIQSTRIGRPFELLDWFSMVTVYKHTVNQLRDLLDQVTLSKIEETDMYKRVCDLQLSSLLERVLVDDFCIQQRMLEQIQPAAGEASA